MDFYWKRRVRAFFGSNSSRAIQTLPSIPDIERIRQSNSNAPDHLTVHRHVWFCPQSQTKPIWTATSRPVGLFVFVPISLLLVNPSGICEIYAMQRIWDKNKPSNTYAWQKYICSVSVVFVVCVMKHVFRSYTTTCWFYGYLAAETWMNGMLHRGFRVSAMWNLWFVPWITVEMIPFGWIESAVQFLYLLFIRRVEHSRLVFSVFLASLTLWSSIVNMWRLKQISILEQNKTSMPTWCWEDNEA